MNPIEIRPVQPKDIRWAVNQEFELLPDVDPAFRPENMGLFRRLLLKLLVLPQNYKRYLEGWIAWRNDTRLGYLLARKGTHTFFIESMGVIKAAQRQGIGTLLVQQAQEYSRQEELKFNGAGTTRENVSAQAFFDTLGFEPYRAAMFEGRVENFDIEPPQDKALKELSAREIVPAYEKWLQKALKAGNPEWEDVIWAEHRKMALHSAARHWVIYEKEEEVGYLRISGLSSEMTAYLSCLPVYWQSEKQWNWLKEALETYPYPPNILKIDPASTRQMEESSDFFKKTGFKQVEKGRFLLFKHLYSLQQV